MILFFLLHRYSLAEHGDEKMTTTITTSTPTILHAYAYHINIHVFIAIIAVSTEITYQP